MKRVQLFEFVDQPWLPDTIRNLITDFLQFGIIKMRTYDPVIPLIKRVMRHMNTTQVIDLCSGASGPWSQLIEDDGWDVSVKLTDMYPNLESFERMSAKSNGRIDFVREPVDAAKVQAHLKGMRTIFSGFHHLSPALAKSILEDAVKQRSAIGIFEFTERRLSHLLFDLLSPIIVFVATPFIRPVTFSRLFWTYCIPVVPLVNLWDGASSRLRTYSPQDLKEMVGSIESKGYIWEINQVPSPKQISPITYLLGYPEN